MTFFLNVPVSVAVADLSHAAKLVYGYLNSCRIVNRPKGGKITHTNGFIAQKLNMKPHTVGRAIVELRDAGFIRAYGRPKRSITLCDVVTHSPPADTAPGDPPAAPADAGDPAPDDADNRSDYERYRDEQLGYDHATD